MYPFIFVEICFNRFYRVCVLLEFIVIVFYFIITIFKNESDRCETKAVVALISLTLLVAATFCIYQAHT